MQILDEFSYPEFNLAITPNTYCGTWSNGKVVVNGDFDDHDMSWHAAETDILISRRFGQLADLKSGSYKVKVKDLINGCIKEQAFVIQENVAEVRVTATTDPNTNCINENGKATVTSVQVAGIASTNHELFRYEWSSSPFFDQILRVGRIADALKPGDYYVRARLDSTNCYSSPVLARVANNLASVTVSLVEMRKDKPGSTGTGSLHVSSGEDNNKYNFTWYQGDAAIGLVIGTGATINNKKAGKYTVRVTSKASGCATQATYEIELDEKETQVITFQLPSKVFQDELPLLLSANSSKQLPIQFEIVSGEGKIENSRLVQAEPGKIVIRAFNIGTAAIKEASTEITLAVLGNYQLTGSITGAPDNALITGKVLLFNEEGKEVGSTNIAQNKFSIQKLREGQYRILVEVSGTSNAIAFSTYYPNTLFWEDSKSFDLKSDSEIDLRVIQKSKELLIGMGIIRGKVIRSDGGSRIITGRILEGEALEGITIYLIERITNITVASAVTDAEGLFELNSIPQRNYYIRLSIPGNKFPLFADLDYDRGTIDLTIEVGDKKITLEVTKVTGLTSEFLGIELYPNPANRELYIISNNYIIDGIQIYNLAGQQVKFLNSSPSSSYVVSDLIEGVYLIVIELQNGRLVQEKILIKR